jgi:hypothetical protein
LHIAVKQFVVDGQWVVSKEFGTCVNGGNVNNVIVAALIEYRGPVKFHAYFACDEDGWLHHRMNFCTHRNAYVYGAHFNRLGAHQFKVSTCTFWTSRNEYSDI